MRTTATRQFNCPVQGCRKTFNDSVSFGNHIRMMVKNGHDDHDHLIDEVDRSSGSDESEKSDEDTEESLEKTGADVDVIELDEGVHPNQSREESGEEWLQLEPEDSVDRQLMAEGYTEIRKKALEKAESVRQLEPGVDIR